MASRISGMQAAGVSRRRTSCRSMNRMGAPPDAMIAFSPCADHAMPATQAGSSRFYERRMNGVA
jgi:hypothetical protein